MRWPARTRALMVTWAPYTTRGYYGSGRCEGLAQHLGIRNYFIHYLAYQQPWVAPLKYPLQAAATLRLLWRERPALVLVQNPPVVAPLVVALFAALTGARFIIDSHSGAFLLRRWRWTLPLQGFLGRRALATIVTNAHLAAEVARWRAPVLVVDDPPVNIPPFGPRQPQSQFTVVVVNTFSADEPIAEVLEAARTLPDVRFAITGDVKYARPEWLRHPPANVEFTGFVPRRAYEERIWHANALVVLTTDDHTVLRGGWEAVDLGQPLITSDWPILREHFCLGAVYVANTAASLAAGIREAQAREDSLRHEMLALREQLRQAWQQPRERLDLLIDSAWRASR